VWKVEKVVSKGDYNYAIVRNHPNRTKNDYVLHHRVVMENHLGRLLGPYEVVHHINGDKKDNTITNLEVMSNVDHASLHAKRTNAMVLFKCPSCDIKFSRKKRDSIQKNHRNKFWTCSKSCGAKFAWKIRKVGRTPEVERAISGNIVRFFKSHDNPEETV